MATTVRDIAKATGVSRTTVSRVLNGSSKVRESTREGILAEVARRNYTPHHAARALATRRTRTIGAVLPTIESSIPARFIGGLESTLGRHGYALVTATTGFDQAVEARRGQDLIGLGAEGLVVLGLEHDEALLRAAQGRGVPIVCASVFEPDFPLPTIGFDNRSLGATATRFLLDRGHEHIAVAMGPARWFDRGRMRLAGVRDAHPDHSKLLLVETDLSVEAGVHAVRELATMKPRPTALLCLSDVLAMGALFEAPRQGLSVPDDLSVMGFDDLDWSPHIEPALSVVQLPTREMGQATGEGLVQYLDEGKPINPIELKGHLLERSSTARRCGCVGSAREKGEKGG